MTVTYPVSLYLKDIDRGGGLFLKQVDDLQIGSEGDSPTIGDVAAAYGCLHRADITDERTSMGE